MDSDNNSNKIETDVSKSDSNDNNNQVPLKQSRWIGIAVIILFFVFGGWSLCPWYLWIVFAILVLLTLGGIFKGAQAVLGLVLLIWGTSIWSGGDNVCKESSNSYSNSTQYNSSNAQSKSEKADIERKIKLIESLNAQFERAVQMGAPEAEQKRISDEAWNIYQGLQKKNLTPEQRSRLSKLFAL